MTRFVFWLGVTVLAIPAIVGALVSCTAFMLLGLVSTILFIVIMAVGLILVVPLFVWCSYMDPNDWVNAKAFTQVDKLN